MAHPWIKLGDMMDSPIYGRVKIVGTDYCVVLVETTTKRRIPIWPYEVNAGYRDWVSDQGLKKVEEVS